MKPTLLIAAMMMLSGLRVQATAIVFVHREAGHIVIGADSLRRINGQPTGRFCKIRPIGDGHYAAVSGLTRDVGLDVWALVEAVVASGGSIEEKVARLDEALPGPMKEALRGERTVVNVELVFVGATPPYVVGRGYRVQTKDEISEVTINTCPDCSRVALGTLGQKEAMQATFERNPALINLGADEIINTLIGAAIQAAPEHVGPPTNILEVTRSGARWRQRDATVCAWTP
jgi:hypothetical protein